MAIKIPLIADVANFLRGTRDVADALDDVSGALDDLGDEGSRSTDKLERSLKDAADAADKVGKESDGAFDKLAKSSKKADDSVSRAKKGMGDFKEEAAGTGREAAASISSVGDSADAVQETLANALGGFGPAGAAAGVALAAGFGIFRAKAEEAKAAVKELAGQLIESGGKLGTDDIFSKIGTAATEGQLKSMIKDAKDLGIATSDLAVAFSGSSADISKYIDGLKAQRDALRNTDEAQAQLRENVKSAGRAWAVSTNSVSGQDLAHQKLIHSLEGFSEQARKAEEIQQQFKDLTGVSLDTVQNYESAIQDLAGSNDDLADATETAAKRQAAATKSTKDSWEDYKDTAIASIDEVIAAQERDMKAAQEFEDNATKVFKAVGQAGVDWALAQGPNADKAMALLANAPKAKQAEVVQNYKTIGSQSGLALAQGLTGQAPNVVKSAREIHEDAVAALTHRINIPVGVDGAYVSRSVQQAWLDADRYFRSHPITIRTKRGAHPDTDIP